MIPATFVRIDSLPITSNGKVDWSALPLPLNGNVLTDDSYVAPRNIVEEKLAAIIAPLLHVDRVGRTRQFFLPRRPLAAGDTSCLRRSADTFGVELSLLNLFEHPTLAEMSEEIEHLIYAKIEAAHIRLRRKKSTTWRPPGSRR